MVLIFVLKLSIEKYQYALEKINLHFHSCYISSLITNTCTETYGICLSDSSVNMSMHLL